MTALALSGVRAYLEAAVLLGVVSAVLACLVRLPLARHRPHLARSYFLLLACFALPVVFACLPTRTLLPPKAQVWSGLDRPSRTPYALVVPTVAPQSGVPALQGWAVRDRHLFAVGLLAMLSALVALTVVGVRYRRLGAFLRRQNPLHALGKVRVLISEECAVAFSARYGGRAYVVLPLSILLDRRSRALTLAHELQHHRQGDTRAALWMETVLALFFWNPAVYGLRRALETLQEFSCDEALIGRRRFTSREYGRCLWEAAQSALGPSTRLAGSIGMASTGSGHILKRRITMILSKKPTAVKGPWLSLSQIATVAVMTAVGFAAHSAIQNRSLTEEQSRRAAEIAAVGSLIPVDHNPAVHAMLVKYTTTPEGRNRMKQALARLPEVKALIESKAKQYGLPADLLVIPMYESGFKAKSISSMKALGMWQFIPQTAERYGMHAQTEPQNMVEGKDDRLDPVKETDSAMRYLRDLHRQFGDWRLAIKAYNEGEVAVDRLMKKQGTRDPWALDRAWKGEDYLAGAIATLIIYKNPSLLD